MVFGIIVFHKFQLWILFTILILHLKIYGQLLMKSNESYRKYVGLIHMRRLLEFRLFTGTGETNFVVKWTFLVKNSHCLTANALRIKPIVALTIMWLNIIVAWCWVALNIMPSLTHYLSLQANLFSSCQRQFSTGNTNE